jgi:hypothetical protein
MLFLVPFTLYCWIPVCIFLFMILPPRRAVIWSFLLAWLFLPMAGFSVPGLPDYTKMSATTIGVLIGAALFDSDRLLDFRLKWVDLPIVMYCTTPFITSYLNGLGLYDGCAEIVRHLIIWGLPYFIGRVYFSDLEGIRELAIGLFIGGLIYVPFCLFEVRMSPHLHQWVYGFRQHSFGQTMRDGGFRPMVFMQHGLMVGMWMGMTTLIGIWLWKSKTIQQIGDMPMYLLVPLMIITVYFCKSKYAILLMLIGVMLLFTSKWMRTKWLVVAMLAVPFTYIYLRAEAVVTGEKIVGVAESVFGVERSKSLSYRMRAENMLAERAMERPWFGWGAWGAYRVNDEHGKDVITDSLWIIRFGQAGWMGIIGLGCMLLLPMLLVCFDWRVQLWTHPLVAPVVVLGMVVTMYMFDHLMNGMVNPIFMLAAGAVTSAHYAVPQLAQRALPQQARRPAFAAAPAGQMSRPGFRPA